MWAFERTLKEYILMWAFESKTFGGFAFTFTFFHASTA
jgi:hypothetical protein